MDSDELAGEARLMGNLPKFRSFKRNDRLGAAFLMSVLLVTGCAASVEKNAMYRKLDDLVGAVGSAGFKCEGDVQTFNDGSSTYKTCGQYGWAAIYGTTEARDRQVKLQSGSTNTSVMVIGPNWVVMAPLADAKAVQDKLGGDIQP